LTYSEQLSWENVDMLLDGWLEDRTEKFASKKPILHSIIHHHNRMFGQPSLLVKLLSNLINLSLRSHILLCYHISAFEKSHSKLTHSVSRTPLKLWEKVPGPPLPITWKLDLPQGSAAIKASFRGQNIQILIASPHLF
jgi:hypothetical protein